MSFIVLQHLPPGHESTLSEILGRGTSLRVVTLRDGMSVDANTIYVAPPSCDVSIRERIGDVVCFSVADTGEGIPKTHLAHIFDRYWTTKEREGSTFFFTLPAAPDVDDQTHETSAHT
jgi:CheB methylesterase/histidine kinase/DNA gyrase B/HSP90-like ATPase